MTAFQRIIFCAGSRVVTAALADLHEELEPYYSDVGRPAVRDVSIGHPFGHAVFQLSGQIEPFDHYALCPKPKANTPPLVSYLQSIANSGPGSRPYRPLSKPALKPYRSKTAPKVSRACTRAKRPRVVWLREQPRLNYSYEPGSGEGSAIQDA